ncbi:lipocalin family protein [Parabacteroides bouchesdurhonensis]|uniref:lipocalin family protein n=1 Tax=Parabacteroides bouchesdurhonensis TaxID=1936995 RepID=UPI001D0CCC23|nr:lipocalin family protein [Parabacteroides bouchesdurhonensis]
MMMKKNILITISLVAVISGITACKHITESKVINGTVIDASMNNITLATSDGNTVNISTMNANPEKVPGVLLYDSVKVTCVNKDMEGIKILTATELSILRHSPYYYIQGTWIEPNPIAPKEVQGFTLNQDGTAQSVNMATLSIDGWNLEDRTLFLNYKSIGNRQSFDGIDTLQINKIDADSLVLSQKGIVIWRLGKQK